jgi:hypothetical protein
VAVSASSTWNPSVDVILRMALQHAGLLALGREPTAQMLAHARDIMDTFFKSMASDGPALIELEMTSLALVAGTDDYVLAADTVDALFPMMQSSATQTSQTNISRMVYDQYQEITDKAQTGTPLRCYVEKLATVTLRFWPVPEQAYTVTFQRRRLMRNAEAGTTVDRQPNWLRGVAYQMAADLALGASMDIGRVKYLQGMADDLLMRARHNDVEGGGLQFFLGDY